MPFRIAAGGAASTLQIGRDVAHDHTSGSVTKNLLRMGLPSMVGFAAANLYEVVDALWVSRISADAVAAVTLFQAIFWVISSANHIIGVGSVAIINRRFGERDYARTEAAIKEALLLKIVVAALFVVPGWYALEPALRWLGGSEEIISLAVPYGRVLLVGNAAIFPMWTVFTSLRGVGDPMKAMYLMIAGNLLNAVLDPFLIFGWWIFPEMGIVGAAVASGISAFLGFLVGVGLLVMGKAPLKLRLFAGIPIQLKTMWRMTVVGIPGGINFSSMTITRLLIMKIVALYGGGIVAIYGVGSRVLFFGSMLIVGMALGVAALTGQNLGAGKPERAKSTANRALLLALAVTGSVGIVVAVFAPTLMRAFFREAELVLSGTEFLRIAVVMMVANGVRIILNNVLNGAGDTKAAMTIGLVSNWVFLLPPAYLAVHQFGASTVGLWWVMSITSLLGAVLAYVYYRGGRWVHRTV